MGEGIGESSPLPSCSMLEGSGMFSMSRGHLSRLILSLTGM